ncbi:MAG: long-chain fatty-acid-CoA ligase [Verrucomicrobiales bacterium]|nr:long-chain fatty-acid-CoA ligase [Verrucomicrobiales bacterium]
MNLAVAFAESAEKNSQRPAIFWGEDEIRYNQLFAETLWVAQQLTARFGVKPGDRVALWLKNCPQFVPAYFAILHVGAVIVPVNNFLKAEEVGFILADAEVDVVLTDATMAEQLPQLSAARPQLKFLQIEELANRPKEAPNASVPISQAKQSDLAVLIYTSGTTGRPKGAMLSHGNLLHNVASCQKVLAAVGDDRIVVLLPMFHSFMMTVGMLLPMLVGGSMVVIKSLHPAKNVVEEIYRHHATILPAVPQFFRSFTHGTIPPNFPLRLCISGGAPLPAEILREFNEKFPIPLLEGYGLSEASPVVTFNPLNKQKGGSIGLPVFDVEVSIQDDNGKHLAAGETGEVCVRGGNVMLGYWKQPEESAKSFRDGWLLTGDVGHFDADSYFYITDRKKDMLLVNGINVYPREIEEVIYRFPSIKEASVIGVPDLRRGEQAVAFVSAKEGMAIDEKGLQQFIREKLADYKVPRKIIVLPILPRNSTGKILKTALREMASKNGNVETPG